MDSGRFFLDPEVAPAADTLSGFCDCSAVVCLSFFPACEPVGGAAEALAPRDRTDETSDFISALLLEDVSWLAFLFLPFLLGDAAFL